MRYTHSNPMPGPLLAAMSHLLGRGAREVEAYADDRGHHLVMQGGPLRVHVSLVFDWYADGVDWADGDLSWAVSSDCGPLPMDRWSDVCQAFEAVRSDREGSKV